MTFRSHAVRTASIIGVVLVALMAVGLLRLRKPASESSAQTKRDSTIDVRVAKARVDTIRSARDLTATVEPTRLARLASPAEGPVARLLVREGDRVRGGQLLVVIGRNRGAQARLSSDREDLRKARDEFERVDRLVARGAVPGESLDKARADLERAKAMVETGEESAADFEIRSPWPGVVSRVLVQEGNYVAPRAAVVDVFDPSSLVLRLALPEAIALRVQRGATARVRFDASPDKQVAGRVTRIYPELDRRLRTRTIEVTVEGAGSLAPGMFARVLLTVEEVAGAVVVPATALVTTSTQQKILFVIADGVAHQRVVELGIEDADRVQVVSGLAAGELVVVGGQQKLKEGARVRTAPGPEKGQGNQGGAPTPPKDAKDGRS